MSTFDPKGPFVRQVCRACKCVCFVDVDHQVPKEGYRCEGCEAAKYERHHFDKSLPTPEAEPVDEEPKAVNPDLVNTASEMIAEGE